MKYRIKKTTYSNGKASFVVEELIKREDYWWIDRLFYNIPKEEWKKVSGYYGPEIGNIYDFETEKEAREFVKYLDNHLVSEEIIA